MERVMYQVEMWKYGDPFLHKYVVGFYQSLAEAQFMSLVEEAWRGGKYEGTIAITANKHCSCKSDYKPFEEQIEYFFECGGFSLQSKNN